MRQFSRQSKLALFLIPKPITNRDGKIEDFPIPVYREREQETDHTMPIEIIGTIVSSMVIEFGTQLKVFAEFFYHGIVNGEKKRLIIQRGRNYPDCFGNRDIIPDRVVTGISFKYIVKCIK